ncbi:hypothetical protein D0T84_20925 [Dysgonomonas sp. 521]|uniref:hypothetical protein n=1 Tax=Dysgonomonas sp. 521 TaxID=2302932 RepID=UPI0013D5962C|nr:hypothetical protein [Dysgonomonas sp. 521]NDV97343.1 hypothetical protein [Dysgonomonas sp. 521]
MAKEKVVVKDICTDDGVNLFEVRLIKDEGVGLLATQSGRNYLILDSLDYWYDLIQDTYPPKQKCRCKNDLFKVKFQYTYHAHYTDDIKNVGVIAECSQCGKSKEAMSVDIDYSPTTQLIEQPLTYCEKPKLKYKLTEFSSYWTDEDLVRFLTYINKELGLNIYCWYFGKEVKVRRFEKFSVDNQEHIDTMKYGFLNLFFSVEEFITEELIKFTDEKGIYLKRDIWRKNEIIQLSSMKISGIGYVYFFKFCNQYLDKGDVKDKSKEFEAITSQLKDWMKQQFVNKRGKQCFDSEEMYLKYFERQNK